MALQEGGCKILIVRKFGLVMLFSCVALSAQIRIVPREKLELQLSGDAASLSFVHSLWQAFPKPFYCP